MGKFLQCEFFTFLKLLGLLIVVNVIVKIVGVVLYSKTILIASIFAIVVYALLFIWKFIRVLISSDITEYQCTRSDTLKKAFVWLSNIV
ncbi:MAG TPA: hypothetical protein PLM93_03935 [Sulfuricurvum sp.]|nr:MAG: hypothetical protein B7Y30_01580 [Campylobacterales bacterium 16-40-21]OZA04304.1 MAG: hypothetical protein B7X89_01775 [Sulfuricurvum sp. 17-40-25]HQS66321.1 hypothetical protein [Sulfuricurvum sp.]HQT35740.1 hypothetical protein [Sulfuricurvum sp.]